MNKILLVIRTEHHFPGVPSCPVLPYILNYWTDLDKMLCWQSTPKFGRCVEFWFVLVKGGYDRVLIPGMGREGMFYRRYPIQTDFGAHPAFYPNGSRVFSPKGKATGAWNWPLTSIWCRS